MQPNEERTKGIVIYHLTGRADWEAAQRDGRYVTPSLTSEGFIHCSMLDQVAGSANRYYAGRPDLVLLEIDPERLAAPLRYEAPKGPDRADQRFPHIYGPLNPDAVVRVLPYAPSADGSFTMPVVDADA